MLRVWRASGQELAAIRAEEFIKAKEVKQHLLEEHGLPICLQQLVHDGRILADDDKLDASMDLQLVLLTISGHSQRLTDAAIEHLASACRQNQVDAVRCLLEAGIGDHVDSRDRGGKTALMHASEHGHLEVARLLVEAGADIHCLNHDGKTALMYASVSGHLGVARLLVEAGADTDCRDRGRQTAMHASEHGHLDVARLLVEAGAEKDGQPSCMHLRVVI